MDKNQFFFDKHVSLYYHTACFTVNKGKYLVLVFVNLREQNGEINKNVTVKDLG